MKQDKQQTWEQFVKTGNVKDYLHYKGINTGAIASVLQNQTEGKDAGNNGGTHPSGTEYR